MTIFQILCLYEPGSKVYVLESLIMLNKNTLNSSLRSADLASAAGTEASILSEFYIGSDRFHVIILDAIQAPSDSTDILNSFLLDIGIDSFSEVTRFSTHGKLFIIVGADIADLEQAEVTCDVQSLLTERELQIAALVALGKVNKQIAKQLKISEWTVATYLRRMFAKLRVDSRAALVYRCAPVIRKFQKLSKTTVES